MKFNISPVYLVGFALYLLFQSQSLNCQDQRIADSLKVIYAENQLSDSSRLELLRNLSFHENNDHELSLEYAEELIELSESLDNPIYLYRGYRQKGNSLRLLGKLEQALDSFFKSFEAAREANFSEGEASAYSTIADVYSVMGNAANAEKYYLEAIKLLRTSTDTLSLGITLLNAGDEYFNNNKLEKALELFEESWEIFDGQDYLIGKAYNLGNIGMVYAEQGRHTIALDNINQAVSILEELEDYYPISVYLTYVSDIYVKKGDLSRALNYSLRSLELAEKHGYREQIIDANLQLSNLYEQIGNVSLSYDHYKKHILFRDSMTNLNTVQQMADLRTDFEVSLKQSEIDLLEKESEILQLKEKRQTYMIYAILSALTALFIIAFALYRRYTFIKKTNKIIEEEKNRSDQLLLNILPSQTAEELKMYGRVEAKRFDMVTVLFTDFKEFTHFAESLSPEKLVERVDYYFSKFDEIITKYKLEKIKTIGDSYMCASGLPHTSDDHAQRMLHAALEIVDFVNEEKDANNDTKAHFEIRIGVNTGPIVAGIVGIKKFSYDIWGDTVNIASRMESHSETGKINISENTYALVKEHFDCTYRGKIQVKNKGEMNMYFVNGPK